MSLIVIRPVSRKASSTTSSFSTLVPRRISRACSSVVPVGTVMSPSLVISSATPRVMSSSKRRSRFVRIPSKRAVRADDRHPRDAVLRHQAVGVADRGGGRERDRIDDHARFRTLDLAHHLGLRVHPQLLVDDADAALARHRDRHVGLGDRVHRRRDQRDVERDVAREATAQATSAGRTAERRGTRRTSSKVRASRRILGWAVGRASRTVVVITGLSMGAGAHVAGHGRSRRGRTRQRRRCGRA